MEANKMARDVKLTAMPKEKLNIEDLVLRTDKDQKLVSKVVFNTNIGDISWRANIAKPYQEVDGFKIEKKTRQKPGLDELPEIIYSIRDGLEQGSVTVEAAYRQWDYSNDKNSYTFSDKQINDMKIVSLTKPKKKKK